MIRIIRTNSDNNDFVALVRQLDKELWSRYGEEQSFFDRFNKLDSIKYVVVGYNESGPVGCGAIKEYEQGVAEVKRMYVATDARGQGTGRLLLGALEKWALELTCNKCVLETGVAQPEAIRLYAKNGYVVIPNYGQYAGVKSSVCMAKALVVKS